MGGERLYVKKFPDSTRPSRGGGWNEDLSHTCWVVSICPESHRGKAREICFAGGINYSRAAERARGQRMLGGSGGRASSRD